LLLAGCLLVVTTHAQVQTTFDGCTDHSGQAVSSQLDPGLPAVVGTSLDSGRPVIHYNPGQLPELAPAARLFLFADECARHSLGLPPVGPLTLAQAGAADCAAVEMLARSHLVADEAALHGIEAELAATDPQWQRLPGPPRQFQLVACYRGWRGRIHLGPTTEQPAKNACVHACGDKLWQCQNGHLSDQGACMETYRACSGLCE
jgi:hypothetical protein